MPPRTSQAPPTGCPEDIATRLQSIDWRFTEDRLSDPIESIHSYPAKFIPAIPGALLDVLPIPQGSSILDPFVGSGTTLVESQRRGHPSTGIDLNPIACLISRVKTSPLPVGLLDAAEDLARAAGRSDLTNTRADIPRVDHWFREDVQRVLANISAGIETLPIQQHDALRLALSSIVVRVSNQESDTRYAAIDKDVRGTHVAPLFLAATQRIESALRRRRWALTPTTVIERDAQRLVADDLPARVGAIITSPPYPNAYEYWLYHKYRMYWLNRDPIAVRAAEIGARPHFFKKDPHTPRHFFDQMLTVFKASTAHLVPAGWLCVVVGRSRIAGHDIDNAAMITEVAAQLGLKPEVEIVRQISATRKSFNLSHARIKTESILVFRKP